MIGKKIKKPFLCEMFLTDAWIHINDLMKLDKETLIVHNVVLHSVETLHKKERHFFINLILLRIRIKTVNK